MTIRNTRMMGVFVAIVCIAGCMGQPAPKNHTIPSAVDSPPQVSPNKPKGDQMDARAGSIEALTRKTQSYSSELEPLILARSASQPPAAPSSVKWLDPSDFNLSTTPTSASGDDRLDRAMPTQLVQATPVVANQAAASGPPPKSDAAPRTTLAANSPDAVSRARGSVRGAAPTSDALAEKLSRLVKDYPRDVSAQLEYQLLQFLKDEPTPQLSVLSTLPPEDRELVTAILDGLTNFRNALRADNNMLLSNKIRPILEMSERLRGQAELTIPTIRFCKRVTGYGNYDPIDPARFPAGKDQQVIVYCEVANFTSNLDDKQSWETRMTWDMTLYAEQGMSVWSDKTETISDSSRNRRHDFFVGKAITLPRTLPIGRYLLKVSIVDTQSNRVAEATVPLVIAAQ